MVDRKELLAPAIPTEDSLKAMGFDVNRLDFHKWLVDHGSKIENPVGEAEILAERRQLLAQSTMRVAITSATNISSLLL